MVVAAPYLCGPSLVSMYSSFIMSTLISLPIERFEKLGHYLPQTRKFLLAAMLLTCHMIKIIFQFLKLQALVSNCQIRSSGSRRGSRRGSGTMSVLANVCVHSVVETVDFHANIPRTLLIWFE